MANPAENTLSEVLAAYAFAGEVVGAARFGQGHINDTFCVYTQTAEGDCVRYILQRMSAAAFKHPDQLMQNIVGVTDYLRDLIEKDGGDAARETMTVLRTKNGAAYFTDSEGGAWRVYPFVENTLCLQKAETPELFYASAKAFGNFQRMLKDYPADTLFETIEKFHDTENRLANFEKALAADKLGRAKDCAPEIAFVKAHAADCSVALEALRAGVLLISQKFTEALRQKGVTEIEVKDKEFDADLSEAVARFAAGEEKKGKVIDVVQTGYMLGEKVLRFAKVVVGE